MRIQLRLGLLFGFISILFFGTAYAKPSYVGMDCSLCHIAPTVTNFQLPSTHDSLTVPITSFTATDTDDQKNNLAVVTGYMVTTSSTTPGAGDAGWQSSPPSQYTFAAEGLQTLYAWAKDAVGNISAAVSDAVDISIFVNTPPVADAGPDQSVNEGVTVALNGSNSDDRDNGIKSFFWEQVGTSNPVTLSDPYAEQPTFVTPDVGPGGVALTFRLTVTDNSDATATDTCIVNVSWVNIAPVADAGADQTVDEGTTVTLDGNASSGVDDAIATYLWEQIDVTGTLAVLSDPTAADPQFTLMDVGTDGESLTFQLTVTDQGGLQATDTCVVNVTNVAQAPVNLAPVADAGGDQSVMTGADVTLDASGSFDPDGDTITYTWKQTAGTPVTLTAPGATSPVFTAPAVAAGSSETLTFELTVTDGGQLQATDTCDVQVNGGELPPVVEPPVEEPPVVEPPVEEPPVVEPPVEEPPVVQPPADDDDDHDGSYDDDDDHEDRSDRDNHGNRDKGKAKWKNLVNDYYRYFRDRD